MIFFWNFNKWWFDWNCNFIEISWKKNSSKENRNQARQKDQNNSFFRRHITAAFRYKCTHTHACAVQSDSKLNGRFTCRTCRLNYYDSEYDFFLAGWCVKTESPLFVWMRCVAFSTRLPRLVAFGCVLRIGWDLEKFSRSFTFMHRIEPDV